MKVIVVGLGIQGRKRLASAGMDAVATVDPHVAGADYARVEDVPTASYEAALVCAPDDAKVDLLTYLLGRGKHVLVEKPLVASDNAPLERLRTLAARTGAVCYTAYNHRFEPHLAQARRLLDARRIGRLYHCRMFYGNGTARDVRDSCWRDRGLGVVADLASHMLDLCAFLFGRPDGDPHLWIAGRHENRAPDHFLMGYRDSQPVVTLEGTLLSWRNTFTLDLIGECGSLHVTGLCKWGPSSLVVRDRVLPSGKPGEEVQTLQQQDPTWALEYEHFRQLCTTGGGNIDTDVWINTVLNGPGFRVREAAQA